MYYIRNIFLQIGDDDLRKSIKEVQKKKLYIEYDVSIQSLKLL